MPSPPLVKPTLEQLARYAQALNQSPMTLSFPLRVAFPDLQTVELVLDPVLPAHRGGIGSDAVNGGVLAAMFDLVIGCAPALVDPTRRSATVQLSINFLIAVRGGCVTARSHVTRATDRLVFAEATVFDERGQTCATASGLSRLFSTRWDEVGRSASET